ncbi:NYN domain-containing protein [Schlesneria sp. T3-172]|uniref:NYN domain-containing protein n=1 Tax=Schlesneria sphaerica TaxID=3373610 RepID=UPI0037C96E04
MPVPFLIIDGYNLMHAAGLARVYHPPGDLANKRLTLLAKLARRMSVEERKRCTVVFDAQDAPRGLPARYTHEMMVVLFAEPGHEADEMIETLISQHSAPRQLKVISSDHRLQTAIRRRRGMATDSEVFLKELDSPHRQVSSTGKSVSPNSPREEDVSFWLDEFEGVSPQAIQDEVRAENAAPKNDWESHVEQIQKQVQDPSQLEQWLNESAQSKPRGKPKRL